MRRLLLTAIGCILALALWSGTGSTARADHRDGYRDYYNRHHHHDCDRRDYYRPYRYSGYYTPGYYAPSNYAPNYYAPGYYAPYYGPSLGIGVATPRFSIYYSR